MCRWAVATRWSCRFGCSAPANHGRESETDRDFWLAARDFDNPRTSLVVDPSDGKIPPLTPEARRENSAGCGALRASSSRRARRPISG